MSFKIGNMCTIGNTTLMDLPQVCVGERCETRVSFTHTASGTDGSPVGSGNSSVPSATGESDIRNAGADLKEIIHALNVEVVEQEDTNMTKKVHTPTYTFSSRICHVILVLGDYQGQCIITLGLVFSIKYSHQDLRNTSPILCTRVSVIDFYTNQSAALVLAFLVTLRVCRKQTL